LGHLKIGQMTWSFAITVSPRYGGSGGSDYNDLNDIITDTLFGDSINVTSIDIRNVEVYAGEVIDSVQFTYRVVTDDGISHVYRGNKYGGTEGTKGNLVLDDTDDRLFWRI